MITKRLENDLNFKPQFTVRQAIQDEFIKTGILS